MAKKKKEAEGGGGANWMDTYGDMVTLLLCFFVLLFSFSSMESEKWAALVGAFTGNTSITIPSFSPEMVMERPIELILTSTGMEENIYETEGKTEQEKNEILSVLYGNVADYLLEVGLDAEVVANYESSMLIIRFTDNVFFDSGSDVIKAEAHETLNLLADLFEMYSGRISRIRVEGHTDNRPIHTARFKDNWDLSAMRATNVVRYFVNTCEIDPRTIYGAGLGEWVPVAENDSEEGRQANRRVDFIIESMEINSSGGS